MSGVDLRNNILFEDEFIIVLHKPAGLMVEPDRNNYPNLQQQVKAYLKPSMQKGEEVYAQHIHRLDRPVSGIILFAKQKSVLKNLSEQFAERKVKKYYQALTANVPERRIGTLSNWLRKEKKKAAVYNTEVEYAEKANLDYATTEVSEGKILWDIQLNTGKYHQIRAQLAHVNCPIIGDVMYGSDVLFHPDAIALNACKLVFSHPVNDEVMSFERYDLIPGKIR